MGIFLYTNYYRTRCCVHLKGGRVPGANYNYIVVDPFGGPSLYGFRAE